jgi:hypothetical protein
MRIILIGMETSGQLRRRFQALGHFVVSCDLLPAEDGSQFPDAGMIGGHIQADIRECVDYLWSRQLWPHLAIFHPDCTYHTVSGAWAFKDADYTRYPNVGYHQRVKPETLVGEPRRAARDEEEALIRDLASLKIGLKVFENPIGTLSTRWRKPIQVIQPYQCGDDASKGTCLWFIDRDGEDAPQYALPIDPAKYIAPTTRDNGKAYWANQTDTGQNKLGPGDERWKDRSRTYPGVADALVTHLHSVLTSR